MSRWRIKKRCQSTTIFGVDHELLKSERLAMPPGLAPSQHIPTGLAPTRREYDSTPPKGPETTRPLEPTKTEGYLPAASATDDDLPKIKEAEQVHVPNCPNINTIQSWQTSLLQNVVAASGHRDVGPVVSWMIKVWATNKYSVEDLADSESKSYVTLDLKLAVALQQMIQHGGNPAKELQDQVNRKMEESAKKGALIK